MSTRRRSTRTTESAPSSLDNSTITRSPSQPAVDVVVPVFNAETTLAETLESVLGQTHSAITLFVVDDGSTDNSPGIAARFAERDARLRLVRQQNSGVAAARNNGAARGSAPYIAFCDADDLWSSREAVAAAAAP